MRIELSPLAGKQLRKLTKIDQIAVAQKIRSLQDIPSSAVQPEKLSGYKDIYRIRVGNLRIVYRIFPDKFYIILIHHRRDVYQLLARLLK